MALFMNDIGSLIYQDPDLYNPLWLNMTLCFCLVIIGNLSKYFDDMEKFEFDYGVVSKAFTIVFGLAFVVPVLFILFFWIFRFALSFKTCIGIMSIYSYSNIFFVFFSFFTLVPSKLFDLIVMGLAGFLSLLFLNLNYYKFILQFPKKR